MDLFLHAGQSHSPVNRAAVGKIETDRRRICANGFFRKSSEKFQGSSLVMRRKPTYNRKQVEEEEHMDKKLYRSRKNKMLCGVCGGLGEYLGIDPTVVRLLVVLLSLSSVGMGVIIYFVAAFIIPEE